MDFERQKATSQGYDIWIPQRVPDRNLHYTCRGCKRQLPAGNFKVSSERFDGLCIVCEECRVPRPFVPPVVQPRVSPPGGADPLAELSGVVQLDSGDHEAVRIAEEPSAVQAEAEVKEEAEVKQRRRKRDRPAQVRKATYVVETGEWCRLDRKSSRDRSPERQSPKVKVIRHYDWSEEDVARAREMLRSLPKLAARPVDMLNYMKKALYGAEQRQHEHDLPPTRLTVWILLEKVVAQRGRCLYTHQELDFFKRRRSHKASLERLYTRSDYNADNIAWIILPLNSGDYTHGYKIWFGSSLWSRDKVLAARLVYEQAVDVDSLTAMLAALRQRPEYTFPTDLCPLCQRLADLTHVPYTRGGYTTCSLCRYEFLHDLVSFCKAKSADTDMSYRVLEERILAQGGRCLESGMPLSFSDRSNWQCRLKKIDVNRGWYADNLSVVCLEMVQHNFLDWSRELFEELILHSPENLDIEEVLEEQIPTPVPKRTRQPKRQSVVI